MAEEVTEAASEVVEKVAEEAVEVVSRTSAFFVGVAAGTLIGAGVGYLVAKRFLETKYQKFAEEEIAQMRDHFRDKWSAAEEREAKRKTRLDDMVEELGYKPPTTAEDERPPEVEVEVEEEIEVENVFEREEPTTEETGEPQVVWDYARELESRTASKPFVLHKMEFMENKEENDQATYTYYEGDDVLTDERDSPIDDIDGTVGLENLEKFGYGSEDPNVVYLHNPITGIDIEVCRSTGEFAKEVANVDPDPEDLMHSSQRRHRPRRGEDDD